MEQPVSEGAISPELRTEFEGIFKSVGSEIIPPDKYDIPQSYDLDKFQPDEKVLIESSIRLLTSYLGYPIIKDNFPDHEKRTAWREATSNRLRKNDEEKADLFEDFFKSNKMRRNRLTRVRGVTEYLASDQIIPTDLGKKLTDAIDEITPKEKHGTDPWEGPTTDWKIEKINNISNLAANVLNSIGK
ncbi:MAG TPA: hypothetical protein VLE44_03160 [Candidatus Saccharimonadales bacterium]|nr:hypothetical protein [Candidatus Saccharimonadales bacterium]